MAIATGSIFPPDLIDPAKKNKSWLLKVGRAISAYSQAGATTYGAFSKAEIIRLKNYTNGRQDKQQYMKWNGRKETARTGQNPLPSSDPQRGLDLKSAQYDREGGNNMSWDIWSPMSKIAESIATFVKSADYRVQCESVSYQSRRKKEQQKLTFWFETRPEMIAATSKAMAATGGIAPQPDFIPDSMEELEVWEKIGGNRMQEEIAIEDLSEHTFEISNWEDEGDRIIYDLIATNSACTRDYSDPTTGAAKVEFVPLENLVYPYFNEGSHHDCPPFAGHYSIVNFQYLIPYMHNDGWSEERILEFAHSIWSLQPSFIQSQPWSWYKEKDPVTNGWRFLDFQVQVLFFEIVTINRNYYQEGGDKIPFEYAIERRNVSGEEITSEDIVYNVDTHQVYDGCYVITGDFLAYGGLQHNQKRVTGNKAMLSYHLWRTGANMSITERAIPALDTLQRLCLKMISFISAAVPPGLAIDIQFITGIPKYGEWELIAKYRETGNLIYRIKPDMRKMIPNGQPFQQLEGGLGKAYMEAVEAISQQLKLVYELTGVTEVFAGSSAPDEGLGLNRMAAQGTANAISKLTRGFTKLKELSAKGSTLRAWTAMKYNEDVKAYYEGVLGEKKVKALAEHEPTLEQVGMYMVSAPQAEMKQQVLASAQAALSVGRDGQPLITYAQYFRIVNMLENGDVKEAQAYLSIEEAKTQKRIQEAKDKAVLLQGQQLQAIEQQKAQAGAMLEQQKHFNKLEEIKTEKMGDAAIELLKMQKDLQNSQELLILQTLLTPPSPEGQAAV